MTISSVAIACRRVGSKRVKSVPASKNIYFKNKQIFRTEALLRQRTFVLTSYILCCFCNGSRRSYDDIEYVEPCDLYSNGIYEYQQVQSVYDSDEHEDDIVVSDDASECASSESVAASGCGETSSDGSVSLMDALQARRECLAFRNAMQERLAF